MTIDVAELAASLQASITGLDALIERRAAELAAPVIAAAQADADAKVAEVQGDLQRRDDLVKELRRRIVAAERNLEQCRPRQEAS
jgi:hypothetical protein